jgi:hypothetical protein
MTVPEVGKLYSYSDQEGEQFFCTVVSTEYLPDGGPFACRLRVVILSEGKLVATAWSAEVEWSLYWKEAS